MKQKKFSLSEQETLRANPYSHKVTESQLSFTKEFKEAFWRRYQEGMTSREIIEELGYDPAMLGDSRISGIQTQIRKQVNSKDGLHSGKKRRRRKAEIMDEMMAKEQPSRADIVRLQKEIDFMRQEIEILKHMVSMSSSEEAKV